MQLVISQTVRRAVILGLILAVACFCYATSTSNATASRSADVPEAGPRLVGSSNLRFTNPRFPGGGATDYDLGDATYGSMVQRYITAAGGVRPYKYSSPDLLTVLANNSTLFLGNSGYLFGTVNANTRPPVVFTCSLTDTTGSQTRFQTVNGTFHLNIQLGGALGFRFAVDNINNGQQGLSYAGALDTLGGVGAVTYSVVPNTLTLNGTPRGTNGALETIGLSLSADGTIHGKPLEAGLVSFKAHATDTLKRTANDRTNTVPDQVVTFNIENNAIASTDYTTLNCTVRGDIGATNKDTIKFNGLINMTGNAINSLRFTTFQFRLGAYNVTGRVDIRGNVVNIRQDKLKLPDGSQLTAKIDAHKGTISGTLSKATVLKQLNGTNVTDRSTTRLGMQFVLSNNVVCADTLEFASRRKGNKIALDYNMGRTGNPMGGTFQILNVVGNDGVTISGTRGDAWKAKFLLIPRFGIDTNPGLDSLSSITVRIGQSFVQKIPASSFASTKNGSISLLKPSTKGEQVAKLKIDTRKFTGELETFVLGSTRTFISPAVDVVNPAPSAGNGAIPISSFVTTGFDLGLDLTRTGNNASFTGEYGKLIIGVPTQKRWVDNIGLASRGFQTPAPPQPVPNH